jgi:hypothetical protein
MKKILLSLAAAAALAAAVTPAAAQPWRGHDSNDRGPAYRSEDRSLSIPAQEWRIRNAVQQGRISRGEARQLLEELNQLRPAAWRLEHGRANNWDYQQLARGMGHVQAGLGVYASRHEDQYGYGYGRDRDWRH